MRKCFLALVIIILSSLVFADLSEFPKNFIKGDKFDGYIVVGANAPSSDAIIQSNLALKVAQYLGKPQLISKTDMDVALENNLVLIGNPCINKLTNELLGNPEPCDKDFPAGEAYIKYIEKDGYKYLIIAGNDEQGTKKAAEKVINFKTSKLKGEEIKITLNESVEDNREDIVNDLLRRMNKSNESVEQETEQKEEIKEERKEEKEEEKVEPQVVVEDKGFFTKIWNWFEGLFGK